MKSRGYQKYSAYTRYVDFKKLDFIVETVEELYYRERRKLLGLDIGCGEGNVIIPLASIELDMVGLDISLPAIKEAKRRATTYGFNISFIAGDAEKLMFRDESFDFVICSEVLEHLHAPEKVLAAVYRILKRKGLLIITVPNGYGPYCLIYDHLRNKVISRLFKIGPSEHIQAFTFSRINRILHNHNFRVLKVAHSDFISFLPPFKKSKTLSYYDCKLADRLPHILVSGWYIVAQKCVGETP